MMTNTSTPRTPRDNAPDLVDPARGTTRPRSRDDGGYSLLEILVSLALMGTVMAAVMAAMFSAIHASTVSANKADLEAVLGAAADSLGDALFVACPENVSPNAYQQFAEAGATAIGWNASTVQIVDVKYWDPIAPPGPSQWSDSNGISGGQCDEAVWLSSAKTMQKVTVRATTPDGVDSRQIEIVITDVRAES